MYHSLKTQGRLRTYKESEPCLTQHLGVGIRIADGSNATVGHAQQLAQIAQPAPLVTAPNVNNLSGGPEFCSKVMMNTEPLCEPTDSKTPGNRCDRDLNIPTL